MATYRVFEEGLESGLRSGDMQPYLSTVCTEATASFAALSNLVNAVESLLREPENNQVGVAAVIRKVGRAAVHCRCLMRLPTCNK